MINNDEIAKACDSQSVLNQIVLDYMQSQKRRRRWRIVKGIIFWALLFFILYWFLLMKSQEQNARQHPHVGLIDVSGNMFDDQSASADNFIKGMESAYANKGLKAVILRINSPGGSAVQADYMYSTVRFYQKKYKDIKVYAVCVDSCASAAYYLASSADAIYANPASMVGSIGVLYNGFGFVDTLQKVGVSRRLQIAGRNKAFMDPFSPTNPDQEKTLQVMLDLVHKQFIQRVTAGRGKRLHIDNDTFSGLLWVGVQAKERGLIDGFASSGQLARDVIKVPQLIDYTYKQSISERIAKNIGTAMATQLPQALGVKPGFQ